MLSKRSLNQVLLSPVCGFSAPLSLSRRMPCLPYNLIAFPPPSSALWTGTSKTQQCRFPPPSSALWTATSKTQQWKLKMGDEMGLSVENNNHSSSNHNQSLILDIYPLSNYYFGSKEAVPLKDETLADRVQRMKSIYAAYGMRTCVEAVILVELFKHPHLLLLQIRNSFFKLPGGRLRPGESDIDGLKRKLSSKLSINDDGNNTDWEVGECLGMWWRPDFETLMYPYLSPNVNRPKECTKLFLVRLPESQKFIVPRNQKLLAVPLCQVHENQKTYGPIISGVPQLLSKFSFNIIS